MNTKTIILGFVLGVGASCNDRAIKPATSDVPSEGARVAACRGYCDRVLTCLPEVRPELVEGLDEDACIDGCLSPTEGVYFADHYRACWDEAVAAMECLNALSCDEFNLTWREDYRPATDGRDACSGTDSRTDPGPTGLHGTCISNVNAEHGPWED